MSKVPVGYFLDVEDGLVDYLEKQGEETIKEVAASNATNIEHGYKLLSILIAGIAGSFLLLTQQKDWSFVAVGMATFTFLWTWCAIYLVCAGLSVKLRATTFSPPDCLYTKDFKNLTEEHYIAFSKIGYCGDKNKISLIRRYRLGNLCDTASEMLELNRKLRTSLDRARIFSVLAPMVSIVVSGITFCYF